MATPAPETHWGLLAVDSDMAKSLEFVAMCEADLSFVPFYFYNDDMEVGEGKDSL
jgi:hypothetical protein